MENAHELGKGFASGFQVGGVVIDGAVLLAPMAGVTDRAMRRIAGRRGAALTFSEMVASRFFLAGEAESLLRAERSGIGPHAAQIVGCDAASIAETARALEAGGAEIIDINMGCPAKKVCNRLAGSALLQDEALVARILERVVRASDAPVTLKTRTGWHRDHRNGVAIARLAEACGIQALAIHGRTRADMYQGDAEHDTVRAIKLAVRIPVIANGDIATPERARAVLESTGCDGVMIGRAAQGRPWIFDEVNFFLAGGELRAPLPQQKVRDIMRAHLEDLYALYGDATGVRVARKHLSWYCRQNPGEETLRKRLMQIETTQGQLSAVAELFDDQAPRAA